MIRNGGGNKGQDQRGNIGRMDNKPPDGANGENGDMGLTTFSKAITALIDAHDKLDKQITKAPSAVQIKTEVLKELAEAIDLVRMLRSIYTNDALAGLKEITERMNQLDASMKEVKVTMNRKPYVQATTPTSLAAKAEKQAANATAPTSKPSLDPRIIKAHEQRNRTRQERAKCEVTLVATTEPTMEKLSSMSYKEITEGIQTTINSNIQRDDKPTLFGVRKPTKNGIIRIQCDTEDEANLLRELNWAKGL